MADDQGNTQRQHTHPHADHHEHGHAHPHQETQRDPRDQELEAFISGVARELANEKPESLAERTGAAYDAENGQFEIRVYGKLFAAKYPSLEVHELAADHHEGTLWLRVLLAHYFRTADGSPLTGRWSSFREFPGGMMYNQAFQGYSGDEIARAFGPDFARLRELAPAYGGKALDLGDVSFAFTVLPRVPIAVICYVGDEEFPASAQLLFDAVSTHYLPVDALATIGGRLTRLLLRAGGITEQPRKPITPGWLGRDH